MITAIGERLGKVDDLADSQTLPSPAKFGSSPLFPQDQAPQSLKVRTLDCKARVWSRADSHRSPSLS